MIKEKETIVRLLNALFPNVKVYLFGSRARGTNRPNSDIDLAIDMGHKLDFIEVSRARSILEMLSVPQKIDLVDVQSVPVELREIILKEGIEWTN